MRRTIALALLALSLAPAALAMGDKPQDTAPKGGCVVGGCSGQLCSDAAAEPMMSTCEFRESYRCYAAHSSCQRQPDGQCGWTPNAALEQCLRSSDSISPVIQ